MAHQRRQIREAIAALLRTASIVATGQVYESRTPLIGRMKLPAINVTSLEETVSDDSGTSAPRELTRDLEVAIEIFAKTSATSEADDALDDLAERVEAAMAADETFGGKASDSLLASTSLELVADGANVTGCNRLVYSVRYFTYVTADLPDFNTAHVDHGGLASDLITGLDT